ncbi:MAG: hypothetical protein U0K66_00755, partial [Paludibacteraceae bacterium]|nr:hypothetical protein [Paludibacteraceae bacterium]
MGKDIFGLRFLSLATLCGLFWSAQGQDCDSNLGSTTFKAAGDAATWQYYDIANVVTEGPSGVSLSSSLSKPGDLEEFADGKSALIAVASNPYKLNAVIADPTLKDGKDYDSDTLMFKDMPGNVVVLNHQGSKTAELFSIKVPNAKAGTEFKVTYTLCNVLNPNSPSVQAAIPDYMMQNPGWESGYELKDINVGLGFDDYGNFVDKPASATHNYAQGGKPLTMADGCKTYTYVSKVPAGASNMKFTIGTSYNATFNFAVKDIEVTGCFDPKISCSAGVEVCQGEQVPLTLDRAYNASSYKWERSTNGGSSWETISTTPSALDELEKTSMYRCFVDGQESNTLTVKAMKCCEVGGKPASRKNVFNETFGYFTGPYDYVDSEGNETTLGGQATNVAYRTSTNFSIADHKLDLTGQVNDGTYAVLVPTPLGYNLSTGDFNPNNPATWMNGVTADHTSVIDGRENGAALFINVQENFKGTIFENTIDGLCPGKSLSFECYIANLSGGPDPLVTIKLISVTTGNVLTDVDGNELIKENVVAPADAGWIKCSIDNILLKDETSVVVQIIADCGSQCGDPLYWKKGNDLIIDDIKFMTCAPPQISAYYDESTLQLDTTVCSDADLEVVMPETELLKNFFSGKQHYVLQYSIDKKDWKHLLLSSSNSIKFNSDEVTASFTDPKKIYMRVIVASEATANAFASDPNMASDVDVCSDYSISDPFTITIDCPTCTASEDVEIISSEKAVVENKKKTIHLCKGESVTLNSNDVTSTTEKGDPYSNFLMTWSLDGVAKTPTPGAVADELVISWEDATEKGLSVKLTSEDADYPGQTGCMKEAEIIIIADPVPDAEFRKPKTEFCEGEGKDLVDMELTKGAASDYTIRWWKGSDTLSGTSLGEDLDAKFFEGLESKDGGTFSYQLVDNKTGCKGDLHEYEVIVNPIPDAPNDEKIQYTINGNSNETMTTDKFSQTIDKTMDLVWFQSKTEPNSQGKKSVQIDRSVATTT